MPAATAAQRFLQTLNLQERAERGKKAHDLLSGLPFGS
jgi:hypothetical protein